MVLSGTTSIDLISFEPNKKRYFVMDGNTVDYVVKVKTKKNGTRVFKLYHSDGEQWLYNTKNTLCLTMYDNGNGIKFKVPDKEFNLSKLKYHELGYITILTNINIGESDSGNCPRIIEDLGDFVTCK